MPQKLPLIALLTSASLMTGTASAQGTGPKLGDVGTEIVHCGEFDDPVIRLKCFDATLPALKGLLSQPKPAALTHATPDVPPIVQIKPEDKFGGVEFAQKADQAQGQAEPDSITSTVVSHSVDPYDHTVFVLSNGQVWIQTDLPTLKVRRDNQPVTITRGFLNSYRLSGDKLGRAASVKRIQ